MRRASIWWFCLLCTCGLQAVNAQSRVGLALGGDGAAAFANVGVLRALAEAHIQPQVVTATGISSYIAALYATGHTPEQVDAACRKLARLFADAQMKASPGEYLNDFAIYREMAGNLVRYDTAGLTLDSLPVSLRLLGTDLQFGVPIIFNQGSLLPAVRATLSSSLTVAPARMLEHRVRSADYHLVAIAEAADTDALIIAQPMDRAPVGTNNESPLADLGLTQFLFDALHTPASSPRSVEIRLGIPDFPETDAYEDYDQIVQAGYREARRELGRMAPLPQPQAPVSFAALRTLPAETMRVQGIGVTGQEFIPEELARRHFGVSDNQPFTAASILASLDRALATGFYQSVSIEYSITEKGPSLVFRVREAPTAMPPEAMPALQMALSNAAAEPDAAVRAARALGKMGALARPLIPTLARDLDVPSSGMRRAVLQALTDLGELSVDQLESIRVHATRADFAPVLSNAIHALATISLAAASSGRTAALPAVRAAQNTVRSLQGPGEALMTLDLAAARLASLQTTVQAADAGALTLEKVGSFAGKSHVLLNGVDTNVQIDASTGSIKFLGDHADLRPGLNVIDNARYWLEGVKLAAYEAPYKKSYAIVVAIGDYERKNDPQHRPPTGFDSVPAMVPGATKLIETLERVGFPRQNILPLFDAEATAEHLEKTLERFWQGGDLADADRLFVYFGGHGSVVGEETATPTPILVTYDYDSKRPTATSFQMQDFGERQSRNLRPGHVLFALDACHAGLATQRLGDSPSEKARHLQFQTLAAIRRDTGSTARDLLVAGTGSQFALYKNGGLFTQALIESLRGAGDLNNDGVIQFEELAFSVRNWVSDQASRETARQDPDYRVLEQYGSGRFMFFTR